MAKGPKTPKYNIPKYEEPTPYNFSNPYGSVSFGNGGYTFTDPYDNSALISSTRDSIIKSLNMTDPENQASLDDWQRTFFNESSRLAQPQLEQSLFDRGLGGSNFYQGSVNDLLSKLATQSVLNKYALQGQDIQNKSAALQPLYNFQNLGQQNAYNLMNLAQNDAAQRNSLASSRYGQLLQTPGFVTADYGKQSGGWGGLAGGVLGGLGGFFLGGPAGAAMGAQAGSALGGGIDASQGAQYSYGQNIYGPTLDALSMFNLPGKAPSQSDILGFNTRAYSGAPNFSTAGWR